jgi:HK97 family phage prohead protease
MQIKTLKTYVEENAGGRIRAKLTTDSVDRDGEVLIPQGMNAKDYEQNPVLFYNHEYNNPVGKVTNIKRVENAVVGDLEFAKRPDKYKGDFFPEFVEVLVRQGIIKGVSVGFVPEENGARAATKADRSKFGGRIKRVFNRWKLLEVSIAPLPANQDALIQAVGKGIVTPMQVKAFCGVDIPETVQTPAPQVTVRRKHWIKLREPRSQEDQIQQAVNRAIAKKMGRIYE